MQHYQAAGFSKRSLDSRQIVEDLQQTECMMTGNFTSSHWAAGQGIDLLGPTAALPYYPLYIPLFHIISLILRACHLNLSKDTGPA